MAETGKYKVKLGNLEIKETNCDLDIISSAEMSPYYNRVFITFYTPQTDIVTKLHEGSLLEVSFDNKTFFNGRVEKVEEMYEISNNHFQVIGIDEASYQLLTLEENKEYNDVSIEKLIESILKGTGIGYNLQVKPVLQKKIDYVNFYGWTKWDALEWIFNKLEWYWYVFSNDVYGCETPAVNGNVITLNNYTGLLGMNIISMLSRDGTYHQAWQAFTGIKAEIKPGDLVVVQHRKVNGTFFVLRVKHKCIKLGDNYTQLILLPLGTSYEEGTHFFKYEMSQFVKDIVRREIKKFVQVQSCKIVETKPSDQQSDLIIGQDDVFPTLRKSVDFDHISVSLKEVPIATPFAHDRAGLVFPQHPDMTAILLRMFGEKDDQLLNGSYWSKNAIKPEGLTDGDFRFDLPIYRGKRREKKNAQVQIDRQGNASLNLKSLRIDAKLAARQYSRPTNAGQSKIELDGDEILLGFSATKECARKDDAILVDATTDPTLAAWITAFNIWRTTVTPPMPVDFPATITGKINAGSAKTKVE